MEEIEFHALADAALEALESALEAAPGAKNIEAELLNGILEISAGPGDFVINKHLPTRQLWFSSPISGAARFSYNGSDWVHPGTDETLESFLMRELEL